MRRNVTPRGIRFIIGHEGLKTKPYLDARRPPILTIGVGHAFTRSELSSGKVTIGTERVRWENGLTEDQCMVLLDQDLDIAENAVESLAPGLNDNQFDALVSFVFNVGVGAFEGSTLLRRIRAGALDEVPREMAKWIRSGGAHPPGLPIRRAAEGELWSRD